MMKHTLTLLFFLLVTSAFAQRIIKGKITDEQGTALAGVNVIVKGTSTGATSNDKGEYQINVKKDIKALIVSYLGFKTQEVLVFSFNNVVDVTLKEDNQVLSDVVVTALGISRSEKSLGYAVQKIDGEDLTKTRDANVVSNLAGRIAGVQVTGGSGTLGGSAQILIRGMRSINGDNQPLFVVDGIPMDNSNFKDYGQAEGYGDYDYGSAIQDLNPNDIETVNVLKGQAATALYGSRGANGVVLVTLKKGGKQQNKRLGISFNSSVTYDDILVYPKYQNKYGGGVTLVPYGREDGKGHYQMPIVEISPEGDTIGNFASFDLMPLYGVDESWGAKFFTKTSDYFTGLSQETHEDGSKKYFFPKGFGQEGLLHARSWNSFDEWDTDNYLKSELWEPSENNVKEFFDLGRTANTNIAFDGGNEKSSFRVSFTNLDQKGIVPLSTLKRNTISVAGKTFLNEKVSAFANVNFSNNAVRGRSGTGYAFSAHNFSQNFNQWYHRQLKTEDLRSYKNPDGTQRNWNRESAEDANSRYWDNPYWAINENYQNDSRNRIFGNTGLSYQITPALSVTGRLMTDFYTERRQERIAIGSNKQAKYREGIYEVWENNRDINLNYSKNINERLSLSAFVGGNQMSKKIDINDQQTQDGLSVANFYSLKNSVGTVRILDDYTSRKKINSVFGGASFGFDNFLYLDLTGRNDWSSALPRENNGYFYPAASLSFIFTEKWKPSFLSFGKARFGWAKVGNDTDPYNIAKVYTPESNFGTLPTATIPNTLNNASLLPEQTSNIEAGLELKAFKNRIGLDLTLYSNRTTDQIIPLATSGSSGFEKQFINAGLITNKGIEIQLQTTPIRRTNFSWDWGLNFAKNLNKIVELNADDPNLTNLPLADGAFIGSINAYEGRPYGTIMGTDYLRDKDGNKLTDGHGYYLHTPSSVPIGNITPNFTAGTFTKLNYKGISFSALVDAKIGGDVVSLTNMWGKYAGMFVETALDSIREVGLATTGTIAVLDAEGNPKLVSEGDPNVQGDEIYESAGEADKTKITALDYFFSNNGNVIAAADVYDASFVKLREIAISYTLPKKWMQKLPIADVTVSLVGRNLAILYKNLPHLDPDYAQSTSNIQGLEGAQIPSTKSWGFNLNLKF